MNKAKLILWLGGLMVVFFSGCSFIRIQNVSALTATLAVNTPDSGKAYTRTIPSGGIVDVFSSHGGRYTLTTIPSEQYRETLDGLEEQITNRLFNERATLTAEQVRQLTENLNHILSLQEQLREPGVSCSGNVPDFDTVVAVVSYSDFSGTWELSCGSGSGD